MEVNKYIRGDIFVKQYLLNNYGEESIFLNEVKIYEYLNSCNFENIPKIEGCFKFDNIRRIYLERIDAVNIYEMDMSALDYIQKLNIYKIVLEIVKDLHSKGVIHNDINPSNILIDNSCKVYLVDFALSSFIGGKAVKNCIHYTKSYSPIENYSKFNKSSIKVDIYSLTALLYYFIFNHNLCDICDLRYLKIKCDEKIEKMLHKGLSFNPDRRFDDVNQMIVIIQEIINEEIQRK